MTTSAAFVTIGQSPRVDLVPEMRAEIEAGLPPDTLRISEFGLLDGMDEDGLNRMRAAPHGPVFVTRLADGREIEVCPRRIDAALDALVARLDGRFDVIVLLCTGTSLRPPVHSLLIEAQPIVDGFIRALAPKLRGLGVMLPSSGQVQGFGAAHGLPDTARYLVCSPYRPADFAAAGKMLAGCDLIVMHCIGYTAAMARLVAGTSGARVLPARRILAGGIRQLVLA